MLVVNLAIFMLSPIKITVNINFCLYDMSTHMIYGIAALA